MSSGSNKVRDEKTLTEQLEHELGFHAGTAIGMEILLYLDRLIESENKDLNWIDLMVWRLTREGVPLPTTIQCLAARAAESRLLAAGKRGGQPTKVMREYTKRLAHPNAAFLEGALGIGNEAAYDTAANSIGAETGYAGKSSSVGRERKKFAKDQVADLLTEIGSIWAQENPEQLSALREYLASVPQRDPGARRGRRDTDDAN